MNIIYAEDSLKELYENGSTNDKKYSKLTPSVIKKYVKTVNWLRSATRREDLYRLHGLNYEKMQGTDKESVRIDLKWRLYIRVIDGTKIELGSITLLEITNHYGDN